MPRDRTAGKKKKSGGEPATHGLDHAELTQALTVVEAFAEVRLPQSVLNEIGRRLSDPGAESDRQGLVRRANAYVAGLLPCLEDQVLWSTVDGRTLVFLVCGGVALKKGLRTFLPDAYIGISTAERLGLLYATFVVSAPEPWPWIKLVALLHTVCGRAAHEIYLRCEKHIGTRYALAAWENDDTKLADLLQHLSWLSHPHLSGEVKRALHQGGGPHKNSLSADLHSALGMVLVRPRMRNPLMALTVSLDGGLNKTPELVAKQLTRDLKRNNLLPRRILPRVSRARYQALDIDLHTTRLSPTAIDGDPNKAMFPRREDRPVPDVEELEETTGELNPIDLMIEHEQQVSEGGRLARLVAETEALCASSARHRVGYLAATKTHTLEELARLHRCTPKTVASWREKFLAALRKRLT